MAQGSTCKPSGSDGGGQANSDHNGQESGKWLPGLELWPGRLVQPFGKLCLKGEGMPQ
jgi:hypothetical protein